LFKIFLNVASEEKFTILGGKLLQTFTTRSLKKVYPRVRAAVVNRQLEGVTTANGTVVRFAQVTQSEMSAVKNDNVDRQCRPVCNVM